MRLAGTKLAANHQYRGFGDQLYDLSGQRPSLDLNFANTKSLVDAATGQNLVTFTRASSGTYVDSQGVIRTATTNEARFDHNPTTGESLGLLVEEQRTNLITTSEALANITGASITNNTTTAPDGLITADTLTEDTSTGAHSVNTASITWVGNTVYTFTIFLKANTRSQAFLAFGTASNWVNSNRNARFDLSTGTVASVSGSPVVASIEAYPNGWYRCRVTATTVATPVSSSVQIQMAIGASNSYTGDGTSGLFFWGAQLEAAAFSTSYIPTSGATVTRSADVASITGSNFSSWYRQDEGTVFAEYKRLVNASGRIFTFNDTTSTEQIRITASLSTNIRPDWQVIDGGAVQANVLGAAEVAVSATGKTAGVYKLNDFQQATNSTLGTADTAGTLPTLTVINIGANEIGSGSMLNGTIRRLTYFPTRLANEVLQRITQ